MFSEQLKKLIAGAIETETDQAMKNWGEKYSSLHEGYAVLKEEVDEARDEQIMIKNNLYRLWEGIKHGKADPEKVNAIREHAELLAFEAVQVAAVCNKIKNMI